jgi:hypothetical protein
VLGGVYGYDGGPGYYGDSYGYGGGYDGGYYDYDGRYYNNGHATFN